MLAIRLMVLASLAAPLPAAAQGLPPGSYQNSCANISVETLIGGGGRNLEAMCKNRQGVYVKTFLVIPCQGDIQNLDGRLACTGGTNPFAPPKGSYTKKCKDVQMAGPILTGRCETAIRTFVKTSIDTLKCRNRDIRVRIDGKLDC